MSDLSAAAAAALGIPEAIVTRSAAARAAETGMSVDEVLSAWAGGGSVGVPATPAPAPTEEAGPESEPAAVSAPVTTTPEVVIEIPATAQAIPTAPAAAQGQPPVLISEPDRPMSVLVAAVGLFVAVVLVGLVGPSIPTENPGARSSDLPYSDAGIRGGELYLSLGCGSCHTQMVRPIVADVGLGAVSLNDSNQVLGARRFGPDLSDIGSRMSGAQIEATILGDAGHPGTSLSGDDLDDLVTYLLESVTTIPDGVEEAPADEAAEDGDEAAPEGES
jgi:cytochrome c oxidase cbb3-type subunit II